MYVFMGFQGGTSGKESACNAGDPSSISGLRRFPGEGNGNPLQYSCLEYPMDRGAWRAPVHGVARVRRYLATKPPPLGTTGPLQIGTHSKAQAMPFSDDIRNLRQLKNTL